jgi:AcrR family transcriptional regulator
MPDTHVHAQRSDQTRTRILDAAAEAFADHGYAATGVDEICRRAGLSKGGFYHHFPSKQALFLALLEQWLALLDRPITSAEATGAAAPQQLRAMVRGARPIFTQPGEQTAMFLEIWIQAIRDPAVRAAALAPYRQYLDRFAALIAAGAAEGSLRPVDTPAAARYARVLMALATGLLLQDLLDPGGADWGQVAEDGFGLLLKGLAAEPAGGAE